MPTATEQVTYLIANYHNGAYIEACLRSVLAQSTEHWRAIVCDDASTDDSLARIAKCDDPRIRVVRNARNQGLIRTLKRLFAESTTDIVAILDPDDMLTPEATARVQQAYREHPDTGLVYTTYYQFSDDEPDQRVLGGSQAPPPGKTTLTHGYISHLKTFRLSTYNKTEGLDESLDYAEDRDLAYKLEEVTKPIFINEPLYLYRAVSGSQSRDPEKTRTGLQNHLRARFNAVERRGITGLARLHLQTYFMTAYTRTNGQFKDLDASLAATQANLQALL